MSDYWIVIAIIIEIDDEIIVLVFWICITFWHTWVADAMKSKTPFVVLSAFTTGERHLFPMTDAVHDLLVPESVSAEARGGARAGNVEFGGFCTLSKEALLEASESFDKAMWLPSATGSILLMLIIASFPQNSACRRPTRDLGVNSHSSYTQADAREGGLRGAGAGICEERRKKHQ